MRDTNSILTQIENTTKELSMKLRPWETDHCVEVRCENNSYVIAVDDYDTIGRISQCENGDWFAKTCPVYGVSQSGNYHTLEDAITKLIKFRFGLR